MTITAIIVAFALALVGVVQGGARADYLPTAPDPTITTVTADALPTAQINGVAWTQVVVGNRVFVGGNFTSARPAGSPAGTNEVARTHLLAYNVTTGELDPTFAPVLNGQVLAAAKSPDGSVLYVGGQFTQVNGKSRTRIAAFNTTTGALLSNFQPTAGTTVRAIAASASTVYVGGDFNQLNWQPKAYVGAFTADKGVLLPFGPTPDAAVTALTLNPSGSLLVIGGRFAKLAGASATGLGAVDAVSGEGRSWAVNQVVKNSGLNSSITSLSADNDSVYGTGYTFGSGGNFEGTFRADGETGAVEWISDCHGDHYSAFAMGDVVYDTSHAHYCGNIPGGFSQSNPWTYYSSGALTKQSAGTNTYNPLYKYASFGGNPAPAMLHWFPVWSVGTFTGQNQAGWSVSGNSDYLLYAGEFLAVNGKAQQGLVRFARTDLAPKKAAPQSTPSLTPAATSVKSGTVDIGWQATFDRDNRDITYRLFRNYASAQDAPIFTTTAKSSPWDRPTIAFRDAGQTPGSTQRYRVIAFDPSGNNVASSEVSVVVAGSGNSYGQAVLNSQPVHWWRMDDATGRVLADSRSNVRTQAPSTSTLTGGAAGVSSLTGTSVTFSSNSGQFAATDVSEIGPQVFSLEAWVKTSSNKGGRIAGYSDNPNSTSKLGFTDRHLYMDGPGRVIFGAEGTSKKTVNSAAGFNDDAWHHLVGTLGSDGMKLYIDGNLVASRADATTALNMQGVWKVGGDRLDNWSFLPSNVNFGGSIDEVAVYERVLTADEVLAHFRAASGVAPENAVPSASFTASTTGSSVSVNGTASSDPDGTIVSHSWNYGDGTPAETGPTATHSYAAGGTYVVTLTVTDDNGATASATRQVTVSDPVNEPPVASFAWSASGLALSFDGSGSSDPDGSLVSYGWDFGDGLSASGVTASHSYGAPGTYQVRLTVTDNRDASSAVTRSVVVTSSGGAFAADGFSRTVTAGWGSADTGGAWTVSGQSTNFGVVGGVGSAIVPAAGASVSAYLNGVSQLDQDLAFTYSVNRIANGGGSFLNVAVRGGSSTAYRAKLWVRSTGTVQVQAVRLLSGAQTVLGQADVAGLTVAPGERLRVRVQALGADPTTFRIKVWREGAAEPAAWTVAVTDASPQLQVPGALGLMSFVSSTATNAPVTFTFDDLLAIKP